MQIPSLERREAWRTIALFLVLVFLLSSPLHYALVELYPSRLYVGALMWCPALAALITLKLKGRQISDLPWRWPAAPYMRWSYITPALYGIITYVLIWSFDLATLADASQIIEWGEDLGLTGIGYLEALWVVTLAVLLLATVEVIRSAATTLGEEIGWRGFFIFELRKVCSFTGVSIISGLVWAAWHWPLLVFYSSNVLLEFATFFTVIVSMSFIMTYYTFKANSLWPAVLIHAVSNVYIQKLLPGLTSSQEPTAHWLGENGIMFALVTLGFGLYFWRKGLKEGL